MSDPDFPFKLRIPASGQSIDLASTEEMRQFVREELESWAWIESINTAELKDAAKAYVDILRNWAQQTDEIVVPGSKSGRQAGVLLRRIEEQLSNGNVIYSKEPRGIVARGLGDTDKAAGLWCLAVFMGWQRVHDPKGVGISVGHAYGLWYSGQDYRTAVKESVSAASNLSAESRKEWREAIDQFADTGRKEIDALRALISDHQKQLAELHKSYSDIQSLSHPTDYWHDKSWAHRKFAIVGFVGILAVGLLGGWALLREVHKVQTALETAKLTQWWQILPFTFPITVYAIGVFWALRLLVRIALSQMHLASDAAERVVISKTFQAMSKHGEPLTAEERAIVLSQMFRHAATGIVKDDAAPNVPYALVTKE